MTTIVSPALAIRSISRTIASSALPPAATRTEQAPERRSSASPRGPVEEDRRPRPRLPQTPGDLGDEGGAVLLRGPRGPPDAPDQVVAVEEVGHAELSADCRGAARRGCFRRKNSTARPCRTRRRSQDQQERAAPPTKMAREPGHEEDERAERQRNGVLGERERELRDAAGRGRRGQPRRRLDEVRRERRDGARESEADPRRAGGVGHGGERQERADDRAAAASGPGSRGGPRSGSCPPRTPARKRTTAAVTAKWLERSAAVEPGNSCGRTRKRPLKSRRIAQAFSPAAADRPRPVRTAVNRGAGRGARGGRPASGSRAPRRRARFDRDVGVLGASDGAGGGPPWPSSDALQQLLVLGRGIERDRAARERLGLRRALVLEQRARRFRRERDAAAVEARRLLQVARDPGRSSSGSSARPGTST